jgi:hypothetical protein
MDFQADNRSSIAYMFETPTSINKFGSFYDLEVSK